MINEEQRTRGQEGKLVNPSPQPSPTRGEGVVSLSQRERVMSKAAFTLAEVLITLGIIGIVAALTIPALMAKYQAKVLRTQFLQANTIIGDALNHAKADEVDFNEIINNRDSERLHKYFKPGNCELPSISPKVIYYNYCGNVKAAGEASTLFNPYCLSNGMTLWFGRFNILTEFHPETGWGRWEDSGYTMLAVDINGWKKKPNKYGHDMFFWVYNNAFGTFRALNSENLRALGLNQELIWYTSCPGNCNSQAEAGIACTPNALADPDYFKKLAL
ncbi:type II secretion system protein [bacterium]|nr:type II secretion system protein [bacterium]